MLIPLKWLKEFITHDFSPSELTYNLTMLGFEVEKIIKRFKWENKVIAAKILNIEDHPNTYDLKIINVNIGTTKKKIISNYTDLNVGDIVALAIEGAKLNEKTTIKPIIIKNEKSFGTFCSEQMLDLSNNKTNIIKLKETTTPGTKITNALNLENLVLDISVTPNRGDALSILGIAREIAAINGNKVKIPILKQSTLKTTTEINNIEIEISKANICSRYVNYSIENVKIKDSPLWLRDRLKAAGIETINNVVDAANYILIEQGQPIHCFDQSKISGNKIYLKELEKNEEFTSLKKEKYKINPNTIILSDNEKIITIAGIIGSLSTAIDKTTTKIFLESAVFNPTYIRRSSKNLNISTESSYRFERNVDLENCLFAATRAAELIAKISNGCIKNKIELYPYPHHCTKILLNVDFVSKFLGITVPIKKIIKILSDLGLKINEKKYPVFTVKIPARRNDLNYEVDLIEEIARLIGFEHIQKKEPHVKLSVKKQPKKYKIIEDTRDIMVHLGFFEVINLPFSSPNFINKLNLESGGLLQNTVKLLNPLSQEQPLLRTTMLPNLLHICHRNEKNSIRNTALFEIGKNFFSQTNNNNPLETLFLSGLLSGLTNYEKWWTKKRKTSFSHIRGAIEFLFKKLKINDFYFSVPKKKSTYFQTKLTYEIHCNNFCLGEIGKLNNETLENYEITASTYFFELNMDYVSKLITSQKKIVPVSRYPEITRDVSIVVDASIKIGDILDTAYELQEKINNVNTWQLKITLFDLYQGKNLKNNKKSIGLRFHFHSSKRTLTEEEIKPFYEKNLQKILKHFQGYLRLN